MYLSYSVLDTNLAEIMEAVLTAMLVPEAAKE
jgi:hypothetical protein